MGRSKIVYAGDTLLDLTEDTVTPETLLKGKTAHNASGELITGTMIASQLQLIVTVSAGATVTATNGSKTISGTSDNTGVCTLIVPEAGTWSVSATLNGQTSNTQSVSVKDSYAVSLTFFSATITVTVDSGASVELKKGGVTVQTKTSTGTVVFTVTETGAYTVTATKNGQTTSGSVNVVSGTTSYAVALSFLKDNFADNDWASIIAACHSGSVPSTWVVGNSKTMTINGASYQVDIIGKNHDTYTAGGKAPLTFQLHDCYADTKAMNSSNTNSGGWTSCAMRSTHLPAILALMPTEIQNGIREVNKLTSAGSQSATINTTADKLFLLSEVEIFGSTTYSKAGEGTQYDYYKAGNSKAKKWNGSAAHWLERSPSANSSTYFCRVSSNGNASNNNASNSSGVAFGFCF
nr:MAG TPA_asm: hypothetical protein [Caudoviricetes sp.]